jgi:hypothetical protein
MKSGGSPNSDPPSIIKTFKQYKLNTGTKVFYKNFWLYIFCVEIYSKYLQFDFDNKRANNSISHIFY